MKKTEKLQENIYILRKRTGLRVPQFAKAIGLKEGTFKDQYRNPEKFRMETYWKLQSMAEKYGMEL